MFSSTGYRRSRAYGEITGIADAAGQEMTGLFDGTAKTAVRRCRPSAKLAADGIVGPADVGMLITGSATLATAHRNPAR